MCLKKRIPIEDVVTIARKLIAKTVAQGGHFHLYFHIHDFVGKGKRRRLEGLESILDYIGNQVEPGNLRSVCMGDMSV